jgi:hypothetical protein
MRKNSPNCRELTLVMSHCTLSSAFIWLTKAFDERSPYLMHLSVNPLYDSLRPDPRTAHSSGMWVFP